MITLKENLAFQKNHKALLSR